MKIGYKKVWGVVFLMLSGLACCFVVAFNQTGETVPAVVVSSFWLFIVFGILFLTRSYVEVWKDSLLIKPLLGSRGKRYDFQSAKDFSIEKDDVFLINKGTRQKLPVSSWLVDKRGWKSFLEWVKAGNREDKQEQT